MTMTNTKELAETIFTLKRLMFAQLQKSADFSTETIIQFEALSFIYDQKEPKMKDLARFFGITPPSITCMIDKLEKHKLLARKHDQKDRRKVYLELTSTGKKFLKTNRQQLETKMIDFLKPLNEKDKKDLIHIYKKLFNYYEINK